MEIKSLIESMISEKLDEKKDSDQAIIAAYPLGGSVDPKYSNVVKELEKKGYVEITSRDPLDDSLDYILTTKGKKYYKKIAPVKEAKDDYTISHKTFSSAVQHAIEVVEKRGYEVDEEQWDQKVALGPKKPSKGKTNTYTIDLLKNGKETPRKLQMQVYYDEGRYELNMYIS